MFAQAGEKFEASLRIRPDKHEALYNWACMFAVCGDLAAAMDRLERAVALGYSDVQSLRGDADLKALRENAEYGPRMRALIERIGGA